MELKFSKKLNSCVFIYSLNDDYDYNILDKHSKVFEELDYKEDIIINVFGYIPLVVLFYILEISSVCQKITIYFDIDEKAVNMINTEIQNRPNILAILKKDN